MKMQKLAIILVVFFTYSFGYTQELTQTVRGVIVDKISQMPLPGANIIIQGSDPIMGASSDMDGNFKIVNVPVGKLNLRVTYVGYKEIFLSNVVLNSGKELVLNIVLEEDITYMEGVVIKDDVEKNKPLNEMAAVSARTFSVEESRKFAAAVNDPARMVMSYAGVVAADDGNNAISIRGNNPVGLLYRMEGVDIPNPNHFSAPSSSGGGVAILSSQLLTNSDFMTGAFPAEYGNALAGVFDLRLRKGNNEKREHTVQAGLLGIDVASEGPFSKNYRGSYLVNYRYSTLSLLSQLGVSIGDGQTDFQDLSYHINLPTKHWGNFSLFGFGGLSSQRFDAKRDSTLWEDDWEKYDTRFHSNTGAAGVKHGLILSENTFLQTSLVLSKHDIGYTSWELNDQYVPQLSYTESSINGKATLSSVLHSKLSARSNLRSGIYYNMIFFDLTEKDTDDDGYVHNRLQSSGNTQLIQAFSQWSFRATERFTFNTGAHYMFLTKNSTYSLEPRASVTYKISSLQSLSLGYGLHGQIQPIGVYFAQRDLGGGTLDLPNEDLQFSKSHHFVLAYDRSLTSHLRLKAEAYYQHLYNIPVGDDQYSIVNNEGGGYVTKPLTNEGLGRNYGLELTVEQFMHRNTYFLLTGSLYESKYLATDGIWRNTRYNANYSITFTGGKEWVSTRNGRHRTFGINLKTLATGGFRTTPIDFEKSIDEGETQYIHSLSFSQQLADYFRADLRISWKINRPKSTRTWALDIQNVTSRQNIFGEYFNPISGNLETEYQLPLIPILSYRIEF